MAQPYLVIIRGIPGSGKSYVARHLAEGFSSDEYVILDPDEINTETQDYKQLIRQLLADNVDEKFHQYRYLRRRAHFGIENDKLIIWNQAFTSLKGLELTLNNLLDHAKKNSKVLQVLIVEVEVDPATARSRIEARVEAGGHDVPQSAFDQFLEDYSTWTDGQYPTLVVDGTEEISKITSLIKEQLSM